MKWYLNLIEDVYEDGLSFKRDKYNKVLKYPGKSLNSSQRVGLRGVIRPLPFLGTQIFLNDRR